jgi:hypothetical protein
MNINYILSRRTDGANPFAIFSTIESVDKAALYSRIRQMPYQEFTKTAYWFAVAMKVKTNAKMRCQVCNCPDGLQVHHRCYDHHGAEHANLEDLIALCTNCHNLFHGHSDTVPSINTPVVLKQNGHRKLPSPKPAFENLQIPDGDTFTLTPELIDQCRTNGAFTTETISALAVERPLLGGWVSRLVGTVITKERYQQAIDGRYVYAKKTLKRWRSQGIVPT